MASNTLHGFDDDELEHVELPNNPKVIDAVARIAGRHRIVGSTVAFAPWNTLLSDGSTFAMVMPSAAGTTRESTTVGTAPTRRKGSETAKPSGVRKFPSPFKMRQKLAGSRVLSAPTTGPYAANVATAELATDTTTPSAPGWHVDLSGFRGSTTVVAPDGSTDAFLPNVKLRRTLPGVTHVPQGEGSELIVAPFTGADAYAVRFTAGDRPLMLDVRRGRQQAPDALTRWNDVVVPANSQVTLTLAADGSPSLATTDPGAGTATPIVPTASVSGLFAKHSLKAPTVSVGAIVLGGTRQYTLTAKPGSAAEVTRLMWSADGSSFRPYDGPIALDPNVGRLQAFADDAAGNRSPLQTLDLATAPITPVTTVTTSPSVPANGYVAGPVTVRLQARTSDGTTARIIPTTPGTASETWNRSGRSPSESIERRRA